MSLILNVCILDLFNLMLVPPRLRLRYSLLGGSIIFFCINCRGRPVRPAPAAGSLYLKPRRGLDSPTASHRLASFISPQVHASCLGLSCIEPYGLLFYVPWVSLNSLSPDLTVSILITVYFIAYYPVTSDVF